MDGGVFSTTAIGWFLVAAGPLVAVTAFLYVRSRRNSKLAAGAAAVVALLWFVLTADWLPPAWSEFWRFHSISAGFITSVLGVVAGWFFIDDRLAMRRLATLYEAWRQWIDSQIAFIEAWGDQPPPKTMHIMGQRTMVTNVMNMLMVQQQWTASMFMLTALRTDDEDHQLMLAVELLRQKGSAALQRFGTLRTILDHSPEEYLPDDLIDDIWGPPLYHQQQLLESLKSVRQMVKSGQWDAMARSGEGPTHAPYDSPDLVMKRVRGWRPDMDGDARTSGETHG